MVPQPQSLMKCTPHKHTSLGVEVLCIDVEATQGVSRGALTEKPLIGVLGLMRSVIGHSLSAMKRRVL